VDLPNQSAGFPLIGIFGPDRLPPPQLPWRSQPQPRTVSHRDKPTKTVKAWLLGRATVPNAIWVGVVMAVVTLVALDLRLAGGVFGGSGGIDEAAPWRSRPWCSPSSSIASTPVPIAGAPYSTCSQTAGCRQRSRSPFASGCSRTVPFLNNAFGTTPLDLRDWTICLSLASIALWADEARSCARDCCRADTDTDSGRQKKRLPRPTSSGYGPARAEPSGSFPPLRLVRSIQLLPTV